jgi:hypothetical protein
MNDTSDQDKSWHEHQVFDLMDGAVRVWLEQETIHLVAFEQPSYDPVELTATMAKKLAGVLEEMAHRLDE